MTYDNDFSHGRRCSECGAGADEMCTEACSTWNVVVDEDEDEDEATTS
jgi:hypothetical protein